MLSLQLKIKDLQLKVKRWSRKDEGKTKEGEEEGNGKDGSKSIDELFNYF